MRNKYNQGLPLTFLKGFDGYDILDLELDYQTLS